MQETIKVLNLGCGNDPYGTHRVDIIRTSTTTHVFDIEEGIKFVDNLFDEVYEKNLLEHLRNVGFHLEEVYRVLKPEGILTIITDNAECTRFYKLGTHTGRYEKEHHLYNPRDKHYSIFTMNHLSNHLKAVGFKIESITYEGTDTLGKWLDRMLGSKPRIKVIARK